MAEVARKATARKRISVSQTNFAQRYDIEPQMDPKLGRAFFLWDTMFLRNDEGIPEPHYTVQETARLFFGKGSDWLRWRYRAANNYPNGYFVLGDVRLEPKRTGTGNRYYTLADIERMAVALAENHAITGKKLNVILNLVLLQAQLYGVIGEMNE